MESITEISRFIRDYGHDPRHMQGLLAARFGWHQLWTALDVIDDADLAIRSYLENDFPSDVGEQYLRIYGVMQTLFVQQDALLHFVEALRPAMALELTDVLKEVREARNVSVGHPTKYKRLGQLSAHGISRATLSKESFQLLSFSERDGIAFKYINVVELIEKQRAEAIRILLEVVRELKREEEDHKQQFKGKKIADCFDQVLYSFEKISEELRGDRVIGLSKWGVGQLADSLSRFEGALKERGMDIETYDSIKYLFGEIEYPLAELRKFLNTEHSDIPSSKAALVYAEALQSRFSELRDIAEEIDEDYANPQ